MLLSSALLYWVKYEVVGDLLAVTGFCWLDVQQQFGLYRSGDIIVIVCISREVQLRGEQLVALG